jgi:hypothetical protein
MPVVHAVGIAIGASSAVAVGTVLVRTASELTDALRQREKAVVIDDPKMADRFRALQGWQEARIWFFGSLIAALIALSISQNYKIELSWQRDWKVNTMDGKVTLTPVERK